MGRKIEQGLSTILILCSTLKKILSQAPKRIMYNQKERKISRDQENPPSHLTLKKMMVRP